MKTQCPGCTQSIEADDQWAGMEVNCPTCEKAFALPSLDAKSVPSIQPPVITNNLAKANTPPAITMDKPSFELGRMIGWGVCNVIAKGRGRSFTFWLLLVCALWALHEIHSADKRAMERIRQEHEYQVQQEKQRYENESNLQGQRAVENAIGTLIQGAVQNTLQQEQQAEQRQRQLEQRYGSRY